MSTMLIYWWLVSCCFLWNFGIWFSWSVNDPVTKKCPYWNHLIVAGICAGIFSPFLIIGLYIVYIGTKDAKYGWSLRYPR